jgi:class 3 adenylate cyclase/ribosomal protein L40E
MRCSKCGAENPNRAKFCGECGSPLTRRCSSCHTENSPTAKFCIECAKPLGADPGPPTPNANGLYQNRDGERRHLTVLFCDLVNSTEIASHLDPEEWRDIAAEYQRTSAEAVTRLGGHTAKYLGDGLMVYFGWPEAHEDDAERAVRAGLALVDEVTALNERLAVRQDVKLSVRVGIDTGSVVVGRGGGKEADVFGEAPNIAARVQAAAAPDSVFITAAMHQLVSGLFVVEDRRAQQLKGIKQQVQLYRVIQPTAVRRRTRGAATASQAPFVGREDEMRLLLSRWGARARR